MGVEEDLSSSPAGAESEAEDATIVTMEQLSSDEVQSSETGNTNSEHSGQSEAEGETGRIVLEENDSTQKDQEHDSEPCRGVEEKKSSKEKIPEKGKEIRPDLEEGCPNVSVESSPNEVPLKQRLRSARRTDSNGPTKKDKADNSSLEDQNEAAIQSIIDFKAKEPCLKTMDPTHVTGSSANSQNNEHLSTTQAEPSDHQNESPNLSAEVTQAELFSGPDLNVSFALDTPFKNHILRSLEIPDVESSDLEPTYPNPPIVITVTEEPKSDKNRTEASGSNEMQCQVEESVQPSGSTSDELLIRDDGKLHGNFNEDQQLHQHSEQQPQHLQQHPQHLQQHPQQLPEQPQQYHLLQPQQHPQQLHQPEQPHQQQLLPSLPPPQPPPPQLQVPSLQSPLTIQTLQLGQLQTPKVPSISQAIATAPLKVQPSNLQPQLLAQPLQMQPFYLQQVQPSSMSPSASLSQNVIVCSSDMKFPESLIHHKVKNYVNIAPRCTSYPSSLISSQFFQTGLLQPPIIIGSVPETSTTATLFAAPPSAEKKKKKNKRKTPLSSEQPVYEFLNFHKKETSTRETPKNNTSNLNEKTSEGSSLSAVVSANGGVSFAVPLISPDDHTHQQITSISDPKSMPLLILNSHADSGKSDSSGSERSDMPLISFDDQSCAPATSTSKISATICDIGSEDGQCIPTVSETEESDKSKAPQIKNVSGKEEDLQLSGGKETSELTNKVQRDTPQMLITGRSDSNPRNLSLSTPRRASHVRTLDFGTPSKCGTDSIACRKSLTSPKPSTDKRLSRDSSQKDASLSSGKQARSVRSMLFKSPESAQETAPGGESSKQSVKQSVPIATRSPSVPLKGGWDKAAGIGMIFGSPDQDIPKEGRTSKLTPKTLLFSPESGSENGEKAQQECNSSGTLDKSVETIPAGADSTDMPPPATPASVKKPISAVTKDQNTPSKQQIKSRAWDADLRAIMNLDYSNANECIEIISNNTDSCETEEEASGTMIGKQKSRSPSSTRSNRKCKVTKDHVTDERTRSKTQKEHNGKEGGKKNNEKADSVERETRGKSPVKKTKERAPKKVNSKSSRVSTPKTTPTKRKNDSKQKKTEASNASNNKKTGTRRRTTAKKNSELKNSSDSSSQIQKVTEEGKVQQDDKKHGTEGNESNDNIAALGTSKLTNVKNKKTDKNNATNEESEKKKSEEEENQIKEKESCSGTRKEEKTKMITRKQLERKKAQKNTKKVDNSKQNSKEKETEDTGTPVNIRLSGAKEKECSGKQNTEEKKKPTKTEKKLEDNSSLLLSAVEPVIQGDEPIKSLNMKSKKRKASSEFNVPSKKQRKVEETVCVEKCNGEVIVDNDPANSGEEEKDTCSKITYESKVTQSEKNDKRNENLAVNAEEQTKRNKKKSLESKDVHTPSKETDVSNTSHGSTSSNSSTSTSGTSGSSSTDRSNIPLDLSSSTVESCDLVEAKTNKKQTNLSSNKVSKKKNLGKKQEENAVMETPVKNDIKFSYAIPNTPCPNSIPMTPRVLSPCHSEATPMTKFPQSEGIGFSVVVTPSLPPTPNIAISPHDDNLESPCHVTRPTDYSSCSSYYNPSDSGNTPLRTDDILCDDRSSIEKQNMRKGSESIEEQQNSRIIVPESLEGKLKNDFKKAVNKNCEIDKESCSKKDTNREGIAGNRSEKDSERGIIEKEKATTQSKIKHKKQKYAVKGDENNICRDEKQTRIEESLKPGTSKDAKGQEKESVLLENGNEKPLQDLGRNEMQIPGTCKKTVKDNGVEEKEKILAKRGKAIEPVNGTTEQVVGGIEEKVNESNSKGAKDHNNSESDDESLAVIAMKTRNSVHILPEQVVADTEDDVERNLRLIHMSPVVPERSDGKEGKASMSPSAPDKIEARKQPCKETIEVLDNEKDEDTLVIQEDAKNSPSEDSSDEGGEDNSDSSSESSSSDSDSDNSSDHSSTDNSLSVCNESSLHAHDRLPLEVEINVVKTSENSGEAELRFRMERPSEHNPEWRAGCKVALGGEHDAEHGAECSAERSAGCSAEYSVKHSEELVENYSATCNTECRAMCGGKHSATCSAQQSEENSEEHSANQLIEHAAVGSTQNSPVDNSASDSINAILKHGTTGYSICSPTPCFSTELDTKKLRTLKILKDISIGDKVEREKNKKQKLTLSSGETLEQQTNQSKEVTSTQDQEETRLYSDTEQEWSEEETFPVLHLSDGESVGENVDNTSHQYTSPAKTVNDTVTETDRPQLPTGNREGDSSSAPPLTDNATNNRNEENEVPYSNQTAKIDNELYMDIKYSELGPIRHSEAPEDISHLRFGYDCEELGIKTFTMSPYIGLFEMVPTIKSKVRHDVVKTLAINSESGDSENSSCGSSKPKCAKNPKSSKGKNSLLTASHTSDFQHMKISALEVLYNEAKLDEARSSRSSGRLRTSISEADGKCSYPPQDIHERRKKESRVSLHQKKDEAGKECSSESKKPEKAKCSEEEKEEGEISDDSPVKAKNTSGHKMSRVAEPNPWYSARYRRSRSRSPAIFSKNSSRLVVTSTSRDVHCLPPKKRKTAETEEVEGTEKRHCPAPAEIPPQLRNLDIDVFLSKVHGKAETK